MNISDPDQRIEQAIRDMPDALRPWLLRVLMAPSQERARILGEARASGESPVLAELLVGLEQDGMGDQARLTMIKYLRQFVRVQESA